jgi:ABC-type polysaccharide/polyol phosphate export permease
MALVTSSTAGISRRHPASLVARHILLNLWKSLNWAWLDTVCQYRRSRIGPLWETINVLVMLLGLSLVSSSIFGNSMVDIIGYIGLGIIIWTAVSSLLIEGSGAFVRNAGYVANSTLSVDLYVGRAVFKTLITFGHHVILYFVGVVFALVPLTATAPLALLGIILLFVNGFWIVMVLSFICARFRDVELFVRNLVQLAFFVTPIFWNYRQISSNRQFIVEYNLLFYFIEIIRNPLLGEIPPLRHYLTVLAVTVVGFGLAYVVHRKMRAQLAFFV